MQNKKKIKIFQKIYNRPISCLTAYSSSFASLMDGIVDIVLVGDSLGAVLYGMKNTQGVTLDLMKLHGLAVRKNLKKSLMIIDMPYKTYNTKRSAYKNSKEILNYTNSDFLKFEINRKQLPILKFLTEKGINVVAHIGVTPQKFKDFKKIKSVGKKETEMKNLINLAILSEKAGAKIILMECVAEKTAKLITSKVNIPTIGIGSSKFCDGQVLVTDDLLNMDGKKIKPKFVKNYTNLNKIIKQSIKKFVIDIKLKKYPSTKFTYY